MEECQPLSEIRRRVEHLLKTEGIGGLVAGAGRFLRQKGRAAFLAERYHVFEFETECNDTDMCRPGIEGLEVVVFEHQEEVERLIAEGGYEVPVFHPSFRSVWLQRGGVAFLAFVDRQPAHIAWVALSPEARGCCDGLNYRVDFDRGEACWGGSYTWPRFRNRGIYRYMCGFRLKYMQKHGFSRCRDAVRVGNIASLRGQLRWTPMLCATGWFVRLPKWSRWIERPATCGYPSPAVSSDSN